MSEHLAGDDLSEPVVEPHEDDVRRRAWEISQGPDGGSAEENRRRAEEELRQERNASSLLETD